MTRLRKQETAIVSLTILFTLSFAASAVGIVASKAMARPLASILLVNPILGQTASTIAFPLPTNVPVGTSIRIGGSSGMGTINQALKQRFEQRFVGTKVELNTQGTGPAIKDLMDNNADLAAIGRTLMPQEKAQGLVAVPVSRHKIAIIVGAENPFKGGLTFEQFAKIFRGEIKDWAQVGGEPGPIRFIDRPGSSDTRQAFRNYPVFKQAPFTTGKTAQQLGQDSTSQVVEALKTSGIGYAIADQLKDYSNVRIVPINNTLPSNPKYPFSQPLIYVYKGPQPNLPAQAFLGYAAAPVSRQTIETARKEAIASVTNPDVASSSPQETIPSPQPVSSDAPAVPSTVALAPSVNGDTDEPTKSWVWLLALPLLGSFVWWVLKNRDAEPELAEPELEEDIEEGFPPTVDPMPTVEPLPTEASIVPIADVAAPLLGAIQPVGNSRLILVPRDCKNAYAYWEIPAEAHASLQQQGAQKLVIRLYDVTGIDTRRQPPESLQEFDCEAQAQDRHLPIRTDDRMYLAELGYIAAEGRWLQVARSESVHVPACPVAQKAIAPDAASDAIPGDDVVLADGTLLTAGAASPVIAVDRGDMYASADNSQRVLEPNANTALQTGEIAQTSAWYDETEDAVSLAADTVANGEAMDGMVWHRSPETIISETPDVSEIPEPVFTTSALAERTIADSPQPTSQSQLILIPRADQALYVYWEADQAEKDALKQQGGQQMVLRVYAATGTGNAFPQSVQQYFCNDWDHDQHVSVPVSNLEYIAELGYMALDGRFLLLARSTPTWVPGA